MTRAHARPAPAQLADRLGAAVDDLEAHLEGGASLDRAARRAGFSRWHFMRVFLAATGLPVAEYLRRRRLSRAAEAIAAGTPVLQAAVTWGYGSQAAFTRAFLRTFGVTPGAYRRRARAAEAPLALTLPFEPRLPWAVAPPPPRLVERSPSRWVGRDTRAPTRRFRSFVDIPAFWDDWLAHERWRPVTGGVPGTAAGLVRTLASGELEYLIALEVPPGTPAPRGYRALTLPGGRYAVWEAVGPPTRTIQSLALAAHSRWLPGAAVRHRPAGWDLERYLPEPGAPDGALRCELWVPLGPDG